MSKGAIHKTVIELLPWLVNGRLEGRERERVLGHLRNCAACRTERDALQQLQSAVQSAPAHETDSTLSLARVNRRIDAWEAERENEVVAHRTGFAWRAGVAAGLVFAVGLAFQLGGTGTPGSLLAPGAAEFETMTDVGGTGVDPAAVGATPDTYRIAVTVAPDVAADEFRAFLIAHRAGLVSGPDAQHTYVLDLRSDAGVAGVLGALRDSPLVVAAAPRIAAAGGQALSGDLEQQ